jgi:low temperature requirement protein LtrA
MQIARSAFMVRVMRGNLVRQATCLRIGLWFMVSGLVLIAGGLAPPDQRLA